MINIQPIHIKGFNDLFLQLQPKQKLDLFRSAIFTFKSS